MTADDMRQMKDSGIPSFGVVPTDWSVTKLKNILTLKSVKSGGIGNLLSVYLNHGVILYDDSDGMQVHKPSQDMSKYQVVNVGDFVLNNQQAWRGSVGVSKHDGIVSPAYLVYAIDSSCNADYMNYLLRDGAMVQQYEVASRGVGTIQRNIFTPWLLNSWIVLPPLSEQTLIAMYLDAKCAEIDALSADVQSEIELLESYKRSVITEAVTKGLDKNAAMKDSGIPWVGEIPETWNTTDVKYWFEIVKRIAGKEGYDVLSITNRGITIKDISNNEGQIASDYKKYQFLFPGEFAMNCLDLNAGWIDISSLFGVTSPDYRVFRLRDSSTNHREYYKYLFQACYGEKIFYSLTQGVTESYRRLPADVFNNFVIPVPPLSEQKSIATYLDAKCAETDAVIDQKREQIAVLNDYKKSVIYEYVTGKKEVPAR